MTAQEEVVHPEDIDHPPPPRRDAMAAWLADRCATVEFAILNVVVVAGWSAAGVEKFPFPFLTLVLSVEAILLTVFVLVQQRLEKERQDRADDADLKNDAIAAEMSQHIDEKLDKILRALEGR